MHTCYRIDTAGGSLEKGGWELFEKWSRDGADNLWIDIDGAVDEETFAALENKLDLHPLALQDASRDRHPPKIETYANCTFIILKGLAKGSTTVDFRTIQIAVFVGERFLVTRHSGVSPSIEKLRDELTEDPELFIGGSGALATRLFRLIVERYLRVLLNLEPRLEELEEGLTGDDAEDILGELVMHRADLIRLQRILHYHVEVTARLDGERLPGFLDADRHGLTDVHEQQSRVRSLCGLYYQLAADLIEGYISVSSHRLNQIMKVLTIITAIFVPLSFLAGIYGMNFENMPELQSRWGYFLLLAVMGSVATALLVLFRRKRWL